MTTLELFNILIEDKPSDFLREREEELFELIPELRSCKGRNQNNIWHPYDVYEHILRVVDNVDNNLLLRIAALFHDIGKQESNYAEHEDGQGYFEKHWDLSREIFINFISKHKDDIQISVDKLCYYVSYLIYYHDINLDKLDDKTLFLFGEDGIKQLIELKRADLCAQNPMFYDETMEKYKQQEENATARCRKIISNNERMYLNANNS